MNTIHHLAHNVEKMLNIVHFLFIIFIALLITLFFKVPYPIHAAAITIGVNAVGIIHYGYNDRVVAPASAVDADLAEVKRMGGNVIRVFVANKNISDQEAARRLTVFLDKAASYNISVIPVFIDFYDSGYSPQGISYTRCDFTPCLLADDFFAGGYQGRYKDFVRTVIEANKGRPNIYAWEPGNELKDEINTSNFINFMKDVTSFIKSLDSVHQIATGMLNASHTGLSPSSLYPQLPSVDIITIHTYDGNREGSGDVDWAVSNGKKAILEEGIKGGTSDRSGFYVSELGFWVGKGIAAYLQWGFIAKGLADTGDGDRNFGMDAIWHTDYDAVFAVLACFSAGGTSCSGGGGGGGIAPNKSLIFGIGPSNADWFNTPKPPEWEVQGIQKIADACSSSTVIGIDWNVIEPNPPINGVHSYVWDAYDRRINAASQNNLKIIGGIVQAPLWANGGNSPPHQWPPDISHKQDFIDFVKATVERYKGKIMGYEFWNEVNGCGWHTGCGGDERQKADEYGPWLKTLYEAVKAVDPSIPVSPTGMDYGGTKTDTTFLDRLYELATQGESCAGKPCFDAVAIHPYGDPLNYAGLDAVRQTMVSHGDSNKSIWITEYGWSSDSGKSEKLKQVLGALTNPPYSDFVKLAKYLIIADVDTAPGYGLMDKDLNPKPSYDTFKSLACSTTPIGGGGGGGGGDGSAVCVQKDEPCFALLGNAQCRDGTKACEKFICGNKNFFGFGLGICIPEFQPPFCNPDQLIMSVSENPAAATQGNTLTFYLSGEQGKLLYDDKWSPSGIVDCSGGFWEKKTCNIVGPGLLTWTHTWKTCADEPDCSYASTYTCSKSVRITINPAPTPTPLPPPCGVDSTTAECQTQIGPIRISSPQEFIKQLITIVLGIAGFLSIILIVYSGYIFMISSGNPEKIDEARKRLTATVIGLLFIVFSVLILEVLGVEILQIPGIGR